MTSYVFRNRGKKRPEIIDICKSEFKLDMIQENIEQVLLSNGLLTVLIQKKYTHIILNNYKVNISRIEKFFGMEINNE